MVGGVRWLWWWNEEMVLVRAARAFLTPRPHARCAQIARARPIPNFHPPNTTDTLTSKCHPKPSSSVYLGFRSQYHTPRSTTQISFAKSSAEAKAAFDRTRSPSPLPKKKGKEKRKKVLVSRVPQACLLVQSSPPPPPPTRASFQRAFFTSNRLSARKTLVFTRKMSCATSEGRPTSRR